jgi:hypothetical protein
MNNFLQEILQAEQGNVIKTTREYIGTRKLTATAALNHRVFIQQ